MAIEITPKMITDALAAGGWDNGPVTRGYMRRSLDAALNPPVPVFRVSMEYGEIMLHADGHPRVKNAELVLPDGTRQVFGTGFLGDFNIWCAEKIDDFERTGRVVDNWQGIILHRRAGDTPSTNTAHWRLSARSDLPTVRAATGGGMWRQHRRHGDHQFVFSTHRRKSDRP